MILIDKKQLLSDIVNLEMPLGISSKGVDATYMEGYWAGKQQREVEIINIINKQQEFKQRVSELEKPKKKHKFRAMTNSEFCSKHKDCYTCPEYNKGNMMDICYRSMHGVVTGTELYRTTNGKYIAVEVIE